jgi:hypothetical protein
MRIHLFDMCIYALVIGCFAVFVSGYGKKCMLYCTWMGAIQAVNKYHHKSYKGGEHTIIWEYETNIMRRQLDGIKRNE